MNLLSDDESRGPDFFELLNDSAAGPGNATERLQDAGLPPKPLRDPLYVVVPVTIIYAAIFLTGIVGNVSTCVVIARNKHMHTATNYYLFSLAVSDLLLLLSGLPPEVFFMWRKHSYVFGETFCVLQSFAAETSANATVLTITAFTIERYVAICHPFQSHTLSKLSRAVKFVIAIWLSALGLAIPQAIQYGVVTVASASAAAPPESYCTLKKVLIPNAFLISICVFFVVPMTVITVLYVLIGLKLRKSRLITVKRPSARGDRHRSATSQSHVIRMLVAVVVGFFICWAPFHAQRLVAMYGHLDEHPSKTVYIVYIFLTYISGVLYYLSTTINPLLYHIMSHKFRDAFKSTLVQLCTEKKHKNTGKRKLYITLTRQNHPLCHNQTLHLVSFHNPHHSPPHPHPPLSPPPHPSPSPSPAPAPSPSPSHTPATAPAPPPKLLKITTLVRDRHLLPPRSRGSSTSSQLTLTTSYSKMDDDGNNNGRRPGGPRNGELRPAAAEERCRCCSCDRKRAAASLRNKCLLKAKSQSAALETIAKKIGLLQGRSSKEGPSAQKKLKLSKTLSSCTISNSSLQDLDDSEFTSSELADMMAQMKHAHEVQV